jgi:hypothetical protein
MGKITHKQFQKIYVHKKIINNNKKSLTYSQQLLLLVYNKSPYIEIQNTENLEGDTAQTP